MYSAWSLQQLGCLIKSELHFHQHRKKIDSQDHIVTILSLKHVRWRGRQDTEPLWLAVASERKLYN
jgi:hypothetical protein